MKYDQINTLSFVFSFLNMFMTPGLKRIHVNIKRRRRPPKPLRTKVNAVKDC